MVITAAELNAWIGAYLWPLFRIGAAIGAMPMLGARFVPMRVRLGLALMLTIVIAPVIPAPPALDPFSVEALLVTFHQVTIGAAMGFALAMVFSAFIHGAQIIAMQMGLGFASLIDPQNGVEVPVLSQFYSVLVMLLFLALDGHLAIVELVAGSFHTLPVSTQGLGSAGVWDLLSWAGDMFAGAMGVALPAVAALLLVNIAFGVMSRAAPQLHIFAVGFPLSLLLGFVAVVVALPAVEPQLEFLLGDSLNLVARLVGLER